jgi:hypothetical protein
MTRRWSFALLAAFVALAAVPVWAQGKKPKEDANVRTVSGTVMNDADQPIEGAVVQLKNTKSLEVRSFRTQQDGNYHFSALSTNIDYELKAIKDGETSSSRTLSVFDSRPKPVINLKIEAKK